MLLEIKNLNITDNKKTLINNFSIKINESQITGISAPTGTGKTTLLNYISGILDSDDFCVTGKIVKNTDDISYVFQEHRLIENLCVLENIMLPLKNLYDKKTCTEKALYWIEKLNLMHKKDSRCSDLSGGEKQRASIARAFAYPGKLMLLDEPFASQDENNKKNIMTLIKVLAEKEKRAVIIISHIKTELDELCENIINL
ncbi:MAG: ATP-binding cassette domain-containing protein [Treponema sp.]|nr:ATP-binding cassette domain-containing protein [Treponema sp.]